MSRDARFAVRMLAIGIAIGTHIVSIEAGPHRGFWSVPASTLLVVVVRLVTRWRSA